MNRTMLTSHMKKAAIGLILLLILAQGARSQGARYDGVAQRTIQNFLAPIPGALITVCTSAGTGTPCTPTTPIYTDSGLTQLIPGSTITADGNGNFGFWTNASQTIKYSITATGVTGQLFTVVLPIVGGGAGTFTNLTATGTTLTCNLNGALVLNPTCFSGTDIIAQAVTAYAALPSFGGTIWIPAPTGGGCWTATTAGIFNTGSKPVSFRGLASANQISTAGVCINFTPTSAVTAFTIDFMNSTGSNTPVVLFQDIALINNGCVTAGGCGSSATGIAFGSTNGGCPKCVIDRTTITGFGTGVSNSNTVSWGQVYNSDHFSSNTTALNLANVENTIIRDSKFLINGTAITSATGELTMSGGSLDSSTVVGFTCTGAVGTQTSYITDVHMENLNQPNTHMVSGTCNLNIKGGLVENDNNAGGSSDWMISTTATALTIRDTIFASQGNQTMSVGYVQCTAPARCDVNMVDVTPTRSITAVGGTALSNAHVKVVNGSTSNNPAREQQGDTLFDCNQPNGGGVGIGDAFFTKVSTTCLHIKASGNTFDHFRSEDSANTHTMDFGSGVCGGTFFTFEDITNTVCALEYQFTTKKWLMPATATGGFSPAAGLVVPLASNTGLQIFNTTTTCTTAASVGATCTTAAITLPVAEADTSYRVVCTAKPALTAVPVVIATTNSSATQFTITIAALTAVAASAASYDCVAGHN